MVLILLTTSKIVGSLGEFLLSSDYLNMVGKFFTSEALFQVLGKKSHVAKSDEYGG